MANGFRSVGLACAFLVAAALAGGSAWGNTVEKVEANGVVFELVKVPAGSFEMGDLFGDGYADERPARRVTLDPFLLGRYEVTQKQWAAVMGGNPSCFAGEDRPVENVSWEECQRFVDTLNQLTGKRFRLPTEAEWEYAARDGGKPGRFAGSAALDEVAWFDANSEKQTKPVGKKKPNSLGLYDMTGNVWEWCADWYEASAYEAGPAEDPKGPALGRRRVNRGGSWMSSTRFSRVSNRCSDHPATKLGYLGLRLAADPE